jgi:hypothetical protein
MRPGLALKHASAVADFDKPESERLRDGWGRDFTLDHGLEHLPAGHSSNVRRVGEAIGE